LSKKIKNNFFILEGEEKIGSINFEGYAKEVKDSLLKVDVFYLTDSGMYQRNNSQIFYGLQRIVYFELTIKNR